LKLRTFLNEHLDPAAIDRQADIPREVIDGLARLGVFGMTAPTDIGGRGFSQMGYCRVMEEIGSRCASTAIFVNVQHSVGMRALLLLARRAKRRWLRRWCAARSWPRLPSLKPGGVRRREQNGGAPQRRWLALSSTAKSATSPTAPSRRCLQSWPAHRCPAGTGTAVTAFLVTPDTPELRRS
jgi:hypothetical protein